MMTGIVKVLTPAFYALFLIGIGLSLFMVISVVVSYFRRGRRTDFWLSTRRDFWVKNAEDDEEVTLLAGRYAVERIPNPCSKNGVPWIVIRCTKIGMPEDYWRRYEGARWAHFQVEIREPYSLYADLFL